MSAQIKKYIAPVFVACSIILLFFLARPIIQMFKTSSQGSDSPFVYTFNVPGTLYEAGSMTQSNSKYWWVNSGGKLIIANNIGETIQGALPANDPWRILYDKNNPTDTDNGLHPQNIFRLVSKSQWQNSAVSAYFKITADNFSKSPNRNESNALLLFGRYADSQNLYYAGIRVDGTSVIKKKIGGIYYTLAQQVVFPGAYSIAQNVNLLPHGTWIGLRLETMDQPDGSVELTLYGDLDDSGQWIELLSAHDAGNTYGAHPFTAAGSVGIRTDFMDVQFQNFRVENI